MKIIIIIIIVRVAVNDAIAKTDNKKDKEEEK